MGRSLRLVDAGFARRGRAQPKRGDRPMIPANQFASRLSEAISHHESRRFDRAEAIYRQLATTAPKAAVVYECWGQLAQQQGRPDEAIRLFQRACQLDDRNASSATRLIWALIEAGRAAEAEKVARRLTEKSPKSAPAWNALGYCLKLLGRLDEAVSSHERAVKVDPKFADGWYHLGLTVSLVGSNVSAVEYHERALALNPKLTVARYGRAQALHKIYRLAEAVEDYEAFIKAEPRHLDARSYRLFALQSLEHVTREQLFAEHGAYGRLVGAGPAMLPGYDPSPNRRLRLAVFSPDLRTHSCAYFLEPLLQQLDRDQFELYLYHDHFVEDAMSARLKQLAVRWRNFVGQPDAAVERIIRADKPDLLIDLCGHVSNTIRLPMFARRLAPVQITYLGYPDTTGVPAMDFRFTDEIADPSGEADRFATEKLVRFAPTAWTYQPPVEAGAVMPLPATSTPGAPVTFGCFSSPTKFSDAMFAAWGLILAAVPNSRLLLKGRDFEEASVREHLLNRLSVRGVPSERIELLPRTDTTGEHLTQYARMDIALDTFPYVGTTTTCEALWMGRPVVTLCGDRHAARVGASLLTAIGRPEWIAKSVDDYVRIATDLARDPVGLVKRSAEMRALMTASPLMNHRQQGLCFSRALRECWIARIGAQSPANTATG
jgi:protein O-GlcNAc transferase